MPKSDLEIAQACELKPITAVASELGINADEIIPYGPYIAKLPLYLKDRLGGQREGRLILVTAMTPTAKGEGKTTTTIGLGQALSQLGHRTIIAIREPSLGPCLGVKGGAAGGGYSQVLPMEEVNLHFTGDLHAVTTAHNLLAAALDNHLHQKAQPVLNPREIIWRRVIDMNDRSLRQILIGLGGKGANGVLREDGFEITAASEVMATLCLAQDILDLKARLGRIIVGFDYLGQPIQAASLEVAGAMASLLKEAIKPNLVQTVEGTPVLVHGGPFANIAHGCNTLLATKMALSLADYVVTEAGFGSDLGAEKFFDIKCRLGGLVPAAAVLVVTRRAFNLHGIENIAKHVENIREFGLEPLIAINRFAEDPTAELGRLKGLCEELGVYTSITDFREQGGAGGLELAEKVHSQAQAKNNFRFLYELGLGLEEKIELLATKIYGASGVDYSREARRDLKRLNELGYHCLPVCIAKTPLSLSDNPKLVGRPRDFRITVTGARVAAGAGFVVVFLGDIMTMPGLPAQPAYKNIDVDGSGKIKGLF